MNNETEIKESVKNKYAEIAVATSGCCCGGKKSKGLAAASDREQCRRAGQP